MHTAGKRKRKGVAMLAFAEDGAILFGTKNIGGETGGAEVVPTPGVVAPGPRGPHPLDAAAWSP